MKEKSNYFKKFLLVPPLIISIFWFMVVALLASFFDNASYSLPFIPLIFIFLRIMFLEKYAPLKKAGIIWFILFLVMAIFVVIKIRQLGIEESAKWQQLKIDNPGKSLAELAPGFSMTGIRDLFLIIYFMIFMHLSWVIYSYRKLKKIKNSK